MRESARDNSFGNKKYSLLCKIQSRVNDSSRVLFGSLELLRQQAVKRYVTKKHTHKQLERGGVEVGTYHDSLLTFSPYSGQRGNKQRSMQRQKNGSRGCVKDRNMNCE